MKIGDIVMLRWPAKTPTHSTNQNGVLFLLADGDVGTIRSVVRQDLDPCYGVEFARWPMEQLGVCESFLALIPVMVPAAPSNGVCVCSTHQLMYGGCGCGAIQIERKK